MTEALSRAKIIVVDDNLASLAACKSILKSYYEVYLAPSAEKLFELTERFIPDLILLDVEMPEIDGYEAAGLLKCNSALRDVPIIFLSANRDVQSELNGLYAGAADYIHKPVVAPLLLRRLEIQLALNSQKQEMKSMNDSMRRSLVEKTRRIGKLNNAVLSIAADLVESRDKVTGDHISRSQKYLGCMINKLIELGIYTDEISQWDLNCVLPSAQLHDMGKIGINDRILNKPGKLTPEEYEYMKTHVQIGLDAIAHMEQSTDDHGFFYHAKLFAGTHHERWDGLGYPNGLREFDIPLEGRLMAIVDVYDALVASRPYKPPLSPDEAADIIREGRGTSFDPCLVDVFCTLVDQFAEIAAEPLANSLTHSTGKFAGLHTVYNRF